MATALTEAEVLTFLRLIENGEVTLTPLDHPQDVYAGNVRYTASNGWEMTIFNDANEWDYIDHLRTADGRECDYDDIFARMPVVDQYEPSDEVAWERYGIPGYCTCRCTKCGSVLERPQRVLPFVCSRCQ